MLTIRHLAVIRAALLFFDEEMSPHEPGVVRFYFDEPLKGGLVTGEVQQLRELLRTCELRYACCSPSGTQLIGQELLTTLEDAVSVAMVSGGRIVAVLLAPES